MSPSIISRCPSSACQNKIKFLFNLTTQLRFLNRKYLNVHEDSGFWSTSFLIILDRLSTCIKKNYKSLGWKWRILIKCAVVDHALSDKLLYKQCILVERLKWAQAFLSTKSVKELWIEEQIRPLTWGRCPTPYTTKFNTEFLLISPVSEMVSISFRGYPAQVTFPKIQTTSRIFSKMYSYIYKINVV